jgi:acyl-CoA dehydrogenase
MQQFRLLVLHTAWLIDQSSTREARLQIAACKVVAAQVMHDVSTRCAHLHGALGVSNLMPLGGAGIGAMGIVDGPTEVHKVTVAKRVLKRYKPSPDLWPSEFRPRKIVEARRKFEALVERRVADGPTRLAFGELLQQTSGSDAQVKRFEEFLEHTTANL